MTDLAATVAATLVWLLAVPVLGVALRVSMAGQGPMVVALPRLVLTALVVSLPGGGY